MEKTHYYLGLSILFFLALNLLSNRNGSNQEVISQMETPKAMEGLGQQLGFISNFSLLSLQKIDNPGVFSFAEEVHATFNDLSYSLRMVATEEHFQVSYRPGALEKKKLHELKYADLKTFEPSFLSLLILELKKVDKMKAETTKLNNSPEINDLLNRIDQATAKYLNIAEELIIYRKYL